MTVQTVIVPDAEVHVREELLVAALRCWSRGGRGGRGIPLLHAMLAKRDLGVLAPVFDSLFSIFERYLGRSVAVGNGRMSADETKLLLLVATGIDRGGICDEAVPSMLLRCAARCAGVALGGNADDPKRY